MVEHQPSKLRVASSSLVSRSMLPHRSEIGAHVAQLVERILGKDEVTGSNPVVGSRSNKVYYEKKTYNGLRRQEKCQRKNLKGLNRMSM